MKLKIPYLTTSIADDLILTLALTPLWTLLGFTIFIYHMTALWIFFKWVVSRSHAGDLVLTTPLVWFGLFLVSYFLSIVINLPNHPLQRILASFNNYLIYVMGFLVALIIYNVRPGTISLRLLHTGKWLCVITGAVTLAVFLAWQSGYHRLSFQTFMGHLFPDLMKYPYFLTNLRLWFVDIDYAFHDFPRINIYGGSKTATGGYMTMMLPFLMGAFALKKGRSKLVFPLFLVLGSFALFMSLSRSALCAFLGAWVLVSLIEKGERRPLIMFFYVLGTVLASNYIFQFLTWLANMRPVSTSTRLSLYRKAFETLVEENLLMGIGIKVREEFTTTAIGSHSTYVGILLVTGAVGFLLFLTFQLSVFIAWYQQRHEIEGEDKTLWKYLGMSYIGTTAWLATDSLDALPYAAFAYFLTIGALLVLPIKRRLQETTAHRTPLEQMKR